MNNRTKLKEQLTKSKNKQIKGKYYAEKELTDLGFIDYRGLSATGAS